MKISFRYITARKSLYLIASHLSKEASLKMDIELSPAQWNPKTKEVRKSHPKHLEINTKLNDYIDKAIQLDEKHRFKTATELIKHVVNEGFESVQEKRVPSFSEFIKEINTRYSEDNAKKYTTLANWIEKFKPGIKLDEWDELTLDELQHFLKNTGTIKRE